MRYKIWKNSMQTSKVVYGDTDSCFMTFSPEELDGTKLVVKKH